ncbi:hypothetical protein scyTo_0016581 [Scyliorhinus torazame]|uniref:FIP-RBD domain-containing protein n=1 Tax=Scyliorhinus torazame TaxID=75743 RepID=A0A401PTX5_SCYTO|nr:hypothetical protein [Scyliorhinus torazame]
MRVPSSEGALNPEPLSAEIRKLAPTPAPSNVAQVTVTDDSPHTPEEIPGEDLPPCEGGIDYGVQPLTAAHELGNADFAPGLGSPDEDSLTGGQEENERSMTPSGIADRPSAISPRRAYEAGAQGYPVAEVETGDLPVKAEGSAGGGRATHTAGNAGWLGSPPSLSEPATNLLAHEMLGHTPPPDPIEDHVADLERLGALQPGATGRSTGGNSGVQETPASDTIVTEERGPFDLSPALGDRSEDVDISVGFLQGDDLVTKPDSSDHFTLSSSEESPIERKPETSGSSVADYDPSDPAAAYAQLTHDELIQLVLKQRDVISKKDSHVRELESYIDNLLVRVMEETPGILRVVCQPNRQAERV